MRAPWRFPTLVGGLASGALAVVAATAVAPGVAAAGLPSVPAPGVAAAGLPSVPAPGVALVLPAPAGAGSPLGGGVLGSGLTPANPAGSASSPGGSPAPLASPQVTTGTGTQTLAAGGAGPTITISPDSGLTNGEKVTVTGAGFTPASAGGMAECNNTPNQPTMTVEGNSVPVGCTNPLNSLASTNASGGFSASFTVKTGTIGPPAQGSTDSAGHSPATDAAAYPCPPTAAQAAAGNTCGISYGDASGKQASGDLHFASSASATTSSTAPAGSASGSGSSAAGATGGTSTRASASGVGSGAAAGAPGASASDPGGSLPLTGFGIGLMRLALLGVVLVVSGCSLVVVGHRRRAHVAT